MFENLPAESVVGLATLERTAGAARASYEPAKVRKLVRQALLNAGLGARSPDRPLADIILPGMSVLLKPNWVLHYNMGGGSMDCMVTHPAFVEAALEEVLLARPGRVIIGDAPIQDCHFSTLVPESWQELLCGRSNIPIEIVDFRRDKFVGNSAGEGVIRDARPVDRFLLFDLGPESLLEPLSGETGRFRNTNYDPDAMSRTHRPGLHQYLLCKEGFEADVILNLPKLKTHRKAGMTGALKNLVGMNGNKDFLPHHRVGGSALGGDCYPGFAPLKRLAEFYVDQANRNLNKSDFSAWWRRANRLLHWHRWFGDAELEGSWYGNDTTWRMVLDLNRILLYGRLDGTLAHTQQRKIYSLTDAIVAGQGQGPLAPEPLQLGAVTFAASCAFADLVHVGLLGFNYHRLPVVREAFASFSHPLTLEPPDECMVRTASGELNWESAADLFGLDAKPHKGWIGHVERKRRTEAPLPNEHLR